MANYSEAKGTSVRRPSQLENADYGKFRTEMKKLYPKLPYSVILEVWNFGQDLWSDGFNYGKRGD